MTSGRRRTLMSPERRVPRRLRPLGLPMIDAATVERYGLPGHLRSVPDEIDAIALPVPASCLRS